ncbi:TPA: hypothetical protein ACFI5M_002209, partial [Neisseria gonorrhoeae]
VFVNPLYLYRYARVRNFRLRTFVRKNKKTFRRCAGENPIRWNPVVLNKSLQLWFSVFPITP